jgi:hypothetical protein
MRYVCKGYVHVGHPDYIWYFTKSRIPTYLRKDAIFGKFVLVRTMFRYTLAQA